MLKERLAALVSGFSKKDKRGTRTPSNLQASSAPPTVSLAGCSDAAAGAPSRMAGAGGTEHDAQAAGPSSNGASAAAGPTTAAAALRADEGVAVHWRSSSDSSLLPNTSRDHEEDTQQQQLLQPQQQPQPCPAPLPHQHSGGSVLRTNSAGSNGSRRVSLLSEAGRASRRSSLGLGSESSLTQQQLQQHAGMPPPPHEQQPQPSPPLPPAGPSLHLLPHHALLQRGSSAPPTVAQHQAVAAAAGGSPAPDQPPGAAAAAWSFGMHSERNQRTAMEDRSQAVDLTGDAAFPSAGRAAFFAVFDGHAGHEAAQYLADHMLAYVLAAGPGPLQADPLTCLGDAVQRAESELVASNRSAGSTLCALLMVDDKLHVAHVGDSRAVLGRGGEARQLTRDHKPACCLEAARVAADDPKAEISSDGYIYGELAVTRAIGSAHFKRDPSKRALIARPDLSTVQLAPEDDFVLLASDGLWDVVANSEAVGATRRALAAARDPGAAARALVDRAQRRASSDNISVITLLLHARPISMPRSNSMLFKRAQLSSMAPGGGSGGTAGTATTSGADSPRSYSSTAPCSGASTPASGMTPRSTTPVLGTPVREPLHQQQQQQPAAAPAAAAAAAWPPAGSAADGC